MKYSARWMSLGISAALLAGVGCASGDQARKGDGAGAPSSASPDTVRVTASPEQLNEGNDGRAQGKGGGGNASGQAGPENQAGGINTPAHRGEQDVTSERVDQSQVTVTPISDVETIVKAPRRGALVGRKVVLTDYKVQSVISDRGFWVGPNGEQQVFAALDDSLDLGKAELKVVVKKGQNVSLDGELRQIPTDFARDAVKWELTAVEQRRVQQTEVYIHVNKIRFHDKAAR